MVACALLAQAATAQWGPPGGQQLEAPLQTACLGSHRLFAPCSRTVLSLFPVSSEQQQASCRSNKVVSESRIPSGLDAQVSAGSGAYSTA